MAKQVPKRDCNRRKSCTKNDAARKFHLRLGHALPIRSVKRQLKAGTLSPPKCLQTDCRVCTRGKYRKRFDRTLTGETKVGKLHADTKGRFEEALADGHKYFLTIVEEYSGSLSSVQLALRPKLQKSSCTLSSASRSRLAILYAHSLQMEETSLLGLVNICSLKG